MAVNTSVLKIFAPAMRKQLIDEVGRKLDLLINTKTPDSLTTYAKQIENLREEQDQNREQLIEKVAYTWFNRLCALRFLDAKGWHPFSCKVLMPAEQAETQPELLKLMRSGSLPNELKRFTKEQRLNQLLDNQIPTALQGGDPQAEVYRELVLGACRSYHHLLPDLFEAIDDATELLLPDDLLTENSVAGRFRKEISNSDCEDVEIIGWLYQFYISEKKDEVIGKVVKSEDIPAATQLFTPNWIVKYMVQNTIGAKWFATYPESSLREQMEFYVEPAEQSDEVKSKLNEITPKSLNLEELTLMDPACGSGHILVEAYNVFRAIYLEQGYQRTEIPELILTKNLYGLDICPRANQLSIFSLLMKGREDNRTIFEKKINFNVKVIEDSNNFNEEELLQQIKIKNISFNQTDLNDFKKLFENAKIFGSLIQIPQKISKELVLLKRLTDLSSQNLFVSKNLYKLKILIQQASLLARRYDIVIANPPYLGGKAMNSKLKEFSNKNYPLTKSDLYSMFIERYINSVKKGGASAFVTPFTWMFLSTHISFRKLLFKNRSIINLVKPSYTSFFESAIVPLVSFVIFDNVENFLGNYVGLGYLGRGDEQKNRFLSALEGSNEFPFYQAKVEDFNKIIGSPIAYWASESLRNAFEKSDSLEKLAPVRTGLQTGDNDRFLRLWHEVALEKTGFGYNNLQEVAASEKKWFPYNKGGPFRKWYGNNSYVVNWDNNGYEIKNFRDSKGKVRSRPQNENYYFKESITWSFISSGYFGVRYSDAGFLFDVSGSSAFPSKSESLWLTGLLCSKQVFEFMQVMNPTLNFQVGNVASLPVLRNKLRDNLENINIVVKDIIELSRKDWDSYERSWNFKSFPLISSSTNPTSLKESYLTWVLKNKMKITEMKQLEEDNNSLFLNAYDLQDELTPGIPIEQITLTVNPAYRYGKDLTKEDLQSRFQKDTIVELISYATGCMMGRYSLEHPGLILADTQENQELHLISYEAKVGKQISDAKFKPDFDGIIPILDGEWFEDDIVARTREFIAVTFPESSVAENLRFIENSIGKDIRKYFCRDFYKDHLQTYKKRPIYWMVQSPNAGFACLIYLHRYTPETLLQVLNDYFRPYLQKLEARLTLLDLDQVNDSLSKREQIVARKEAEKINKVIKECQDWEKEALLPLAQKRIKLDLDDGVKVNYPKLQDVLAKIPGLKAKGEK